MSEKEKAGSNKPVNHKRKKRRWTIILIVLGVVLIARIIMPFVILHYANKKLASLKGYYGHIDDIDLALIRGAYVINNVYLNKVDSVTHDTTEFFRDHNIDISVEWHALFQGKIVGEIEFDQPYLAYTMNKTIGNGAQEKDTVNLIHLIKEFVPLRINRFAVNDGQVHYKDPTRSPVVDVPLTHLDIEGLGLTNQPTDTILPASIKATGNLYDGHIKVDTKLDPLNDVPTFDMNGELTRTNLVYLNGFFTAYGNFDVSKGTMSTYTEMAARDGNFKGYVKPLISDIDVVQFNSKEGSPLQIAWEALVGTVLEIVTNQRTQEIGTKVPIEGKFKNPKVGIGDAILALLRNAFIQSLKPAIDNTVNIQNVNAGQQKKPGLFERVFGKDKDVDVKKNEKGDKKKKPK